MRADQQSLAAVATAGASEVAAVLLLAVQPHAWAVLPSGLLHVVAVASLLRLREVAPTRRQLAAAMAFCLPLIGIAMAALVVGLRGRSGDELLAGHGPVRRAASGAELTRRLTAGAPTCQILLSADAETRRSAIAALQRDPDARAIALLRWSLAQPGPDLALDAALALEELSVRHAERSAQACAEADRRPARDSAIAAAEELASAIHNGLADPALRPAIAARARDYYRRAAELDEHRAPELALSRARLELAMLDPEAALALIEPVLHTAGDPQLRELHRDAAHAARRFDLLARADASPAVAVADRAPCPAPPAHDPPCAGEPSVARPAVVVTWHASESEWLHGSA
ncbi:MAG TPA: hypothetical protein VHW23_39315 [Kofleriaceae bacterium]|jgi:hypothetical protein|nr:hypothetical protein [Kofleriaceae bacterium]